MEEFIEVTVSPFYNGRGWTDSLTGIEFKPDPRGLYAIRINKRENLDGIQNSVRLNNLLLLKGSFDKPATELKIEDINPEELTKEQFAVLAAKLQSGSDDGIGQEELDAVEAQLSTVQGQLTTATSEKNEAITAKDTAVAEKEAAVTSLNQLKQDFYTKHTFVAEDVSGAFYTVAVLKEILDAKSIAYGASDTKAVLIEKLTAVAPAE